MQYRVVRPIDPHDVIDATDDKPAKRVRGYAIGETLDAGTDKDVVQALCDRNFVVPVNVPAAASVEPVKPAAEPKGA